MGTGMPGRVFGTRDSGTRGLGCGDACMRGRRDWGGGDSGYARSGMRRRQDWGHARSGTRGGEKQKEPFSASNEDKIQFAENQRSLALRGTV